MSNGAENTADGGHGTDGPDEACTLREWLLTATPAELRRMDARVVDARVVDARDEARIIEA